MGSQVEDRLRLRTPVIEAGQRRGPALTTVIDRPQPQDAVGRVERQTADEHRVRDREDGGVGADPERQDRSGCQREPAVLDEETPGEADVLDEFIEEAASPLFPDPLLRPFHPAQTTKRLASGSSLIPSLAPQLISFHLHMETHLLGQLRLHVVLAEQDPQPTPQSLRPGHGHACDLL